MTLRWRVLRALSATSLREYLRTPEAVLWTYGFPLIMALVLGLAFHRAEPAPARIAVVAEAEEFAALFAALDEHGGSEIVVDRVAADEAERRLAHGEFDAVVSGTLAEPEIRFDPTRTEAVSARHRAVDAFRRAIGFEDVVAPVIRPVDEPGDRYIDFLIPGLVGINLLGAGLFGVGYNLVLFRVRHMLRRFAVTPLSRTEFLLGFLASRLVLALPAPVVILLFGRLVFGVPIDGSMFAVAVLIVLGAFMFSGLGLLLASRVETIEGVSGLMNLIMLPMWLLGGSFFSNERFPDALQPLVQAIPLTHLNAAFREVAQGGGLADCGLEIAVVCGFAAAFFLLAVRRFRWG